MGKEQWLLVWQHHLDKAQAELLYMTYSFQAWEFIRLVMIMITFVKDYFKTMMCCHISSHNTFINMYIFR